MTFTVTYRSKTGAKTEIEIEAESRADCVAGCKSRGIMPMAIREGRGGKRAGTASSPRRSGASATSSNGRGLVLVVAVLCIVVLGGGLWWWLSRDEARPPQTKQTTAKHKPTGIKETKNPAPKVVADGKGSPKAPEKKPKARPRPSDGLEADNPVQPAVAATETNTPAVQPPPPPVFSNVSDQVIAMALSPSESGIPPIPLTPDMEKAFLKSLETKIVILDTDDEKVREMKQAVIETRAEVKRLMDGGQTFAQIIREHQHLANENAKLRTDALIELKRLKDSGDIEGAVQYKKKVNAAFAQMGIRELAIPVTEEEQAERDAARLERLRQRKEAAARAAGNAP